jgi:hypothetical protein
MSSYYDTILYNSSPEKAEIQHPFQLCQQRSSLCSFKTCDPLARIAGGNKENMFYHRLLA